MRRGWLLASIAVLCLSARGIAAAPPATAATGTSAPALSTEAANQWIDLLDSSDPATRQRAKEKLLGLGLAARPALLDAQREGSPEVRLRAAEILLKLPWTDRADSPAVKRLLND